MDEENLWRHKAIEFIISTALWRLYCFSVNSPMKEFGTTSVIYLAPYSVEGLKCILLNKGKKKIIFSAFYLFFVVMVLVSAFAMMLEKCKSAELFGIPIEHNIMTWVVFLFGTLPLPFIKMY